MVALPRGNVAFCWRCDGKPPAVPLRRRQAVGAGAQGNGRVILCEDGPGGRPALFDGAERLVVVRQADQLAPALAELDAARAAGKWVAGYLSYEAGYALEPRLAPLMPVPGATPLLAFGIYDGPVSYTHLDVYKRQVSG